MIETLGTWAARHRRWVISGWLIALVAVAIGNHALGGVYSDTLTIPGSSAQQGLNLLRAHDKTAGGQSGQVVFVDHGGSVTSQRTAIEQTRSNLEALPHVLAVSDPLGQGTVSKDGSTAYATVNFDTNPQSLGDAYISQVDKAVAPARQAGVKVSYGGQLGQAAAPKANDVASEGIGFGVALLVLLAGFGSVVGGGAAARQRASSAVVIGRQPPGDGGRGDEFGTSCADARDDDRARRRHRLRAVPDHALRQRLIDGDASSRRRPKHGVDQRPGGRWSRPRRSSLALLRPVRIRDHVHRQARAGSGRSPCASRPPAGDDARAGRAAGARRNEDRPAGTCAPGRRDRQRRATPGTATPQRDRAPPVALRARGLGRDPARPRDPAAVDPNSATSTTAPSRPATPTARPMT